MKQSGIDKYWRCVETRYIMRWRPLQKTGKGPMTCSRPCSLRSKRALISLLSCIFYIAGAAQHKREINAVGCFRNVRTDGEHAGGYTVQLWASGGEIIGIVDYHRGAAGSSAMGFLTDMQYEPLTGKISFQAKLTTGLHYCSEHKSVPSQDLLSFQGVLKPDALQGNIVLSNQLDSPPVLVDRREDFLMRLDQDCRPEHFESYEIWWWYWEPVYKFRGPDW